MSDWDASDDEATKKTTAPVIVAPKKAKKWEGEDEDGGGPVVSLFPLPYHLISTRHTRQTRQTPTLVLIWVRGIR